jgi:hypothetical protein
LRSDLLDFLFLSDAGFIMRLPIMNVMPRLGFTQAPRGKERGAGVVTLELQQEEHQRKETICRRRREEY